MVSSVSNEKIATSASFTQQVSVDAASGAASGFVCFFFEGLKKRGQRGEISSTDFFNWKNGKLLKVLHPREAFRGATSFSGAVALNSAVGLTFTKYLRSLSFCNESELHQMLSAVGGGMLGACVASTPVENTIVVQQEFEKGPIEAWKHMFKQGWLRPFVGMRELMVREAGFIGSVMYFGPKVQEEVIKKTNSQALGTFGAVGVGVVGSVLTHPFDTVATWRQKKEGRINVRQACKELYALDGMRSFYRGVAARIGLFTGCYFGLLVLPPKLNQALNSLVDSKQAK